jgi:D-glycero-beta-D-manno-heptose-7-phosphate kinase
MNVVDLFERFKNVRVGIIGDVMLDTYMWGHVERISPEAPVPVVSLDKKEQRIGGAGNVALNIQSLGAKAWVISVTGDDDEARQLDSLLTTNHINADYSIKSKSRITTNKTRIISRNQQMMRLDSEITNDLTSEEEQLIISSFTSFITSVKPDIVILEDYNKGVLTEKLIHEVISICRENNVLTAVDPKRKNFFEYKGADIFKPNLKEVKEALNLLFTDATQPLLEKIHGEIKQFLEHDISFITLSEKGVFYQQDKESLIIPSHLRNVSDVSGAGDTVIAVAALVYAATRNVHLMAEMANIAGGLVCEVVGTTAVDPEKLMHECELLLS